MLIDYKELSPVRKSVEIEIPAEAIQDALRTITSEFAREVRLPGFRKGKTPTAVVRSRFAKEISDEVRDRLLPRFFFEAISSKELVTIGDPELREVGEVAEGQPLRFAAEFDVKPKIELKEYRGLEVVEPKVEVAESDIDAMVERFRDQAGSMSPITDRPVQEGDVVTVDVVSSGEEVEARTSEDYQFRVGVDAPLPELTDNLTGKSIGDKVEFDKVYGDDAPNDVVRGKTIHYGVELKAIQEVIRPEADDDFAKSIGIGETMADMRERIRQDLMRHRQHEADQAKRKEAGEKLVDMHEVEAPQTMVESDLTQAVRDYARFLASQGVDLEKAEIDWMKVRTEFEAASVRRVKRSLVLEAIAKKEDLSVADNEVDIEIRRAMPEGKRDFAEVKHRLRHDGTYENIRTSLLTDKALELVVKEARIVPPATA